MATSAVHAVGGAIRGLKMPKSAFVRGAGVMSLAVGGMYAASQAARRGRLRRVTEAIGFPAPVTEATVQNDEVAISLAELAHAATMDGTAESRAAFCRLVNAVNGFLGACEDVEALAVDVAAETTVEGVCTHAEYVAQVLEEYLHAARVPVMLDSPARPMVEDLLLSGMSTPVDAHWAAAVLALLRFTDAHVTLSAQILNAATLQFTLSCQGDLAMMLGEKRDAPRDAPKRHDI